MTFLTVLVLFLLQCLGQWVGFVVVAGGIKGFEAQEQQENGGDNLGSERIQDRRSPGQLHQHA